MACNMEWLWNLVQSTAEGFCKLFTFVVFTLGGTVSGWFLRKAFIKPECNQEQTTNLKELCKPEVNQAINESNDIGNTNVICRNDPKTTNEYITDIVVGAAVALIMIATYVMVSKTLRRRITN